MGQWGLKICFCLVHTYTKISLVVLRFCVVSYCELVALFKTQLLKIIRSGNTSPSVPGAKQKLSLWADSSHRFLPPFYGQLCSCTIVASYIQKDRTF